VLELNGCDCKTIDEMANPKNAAYTREQLQRMFERTSGERGADFLWCDRYRGLIVARRWQITIVPRDGKLTRIKEPTTALSGP
jgi:hypothetical protein